MSFGIKKAINTMVDEVKTKVSESAGKNPVEVKKALLDIKGFNTLPSDMINQIVKDLSFDNFTIGNEVNPKNSTYEERIRYAPSRSK